MAVTHLIQFHDVLRKTLAGACRLKKRNLSFEATKCNSSYDPLTDYRAGTKHETRNTILICGDGDLGFGASLATSLEKEQTKNIDLIVSVLESENQHTSVYKHSQYNIETIRRLGHEVIFELDATRLHRYFGEGSKLFDRVQFNFPHWRGKTNNRKNRKLLSDFFSSSRKVLSPGGQVHVALSDTQGGTKARSQLEWKMSWMPGRLAAEHNLLLSHEFNFKPNYNLSAYQFRDRPFFENADTQLYIFSDPDGSVTAPKNLQMCSYFSLFAALPPTPSHLDFDMWGEEEILDNTFIQNLAQSIVPDGIRVKTYFKSLRADDSVPVGREHSSAAEYQVVFFGERLPVTPQDSQIYKDLIDDEIQRRTVGTRRGKWPPSHAVPSSLVSAHWLGYNKVA